MALNVVPLETAAAKLARNAAAAAQDYVEAAIAAAGLWKTATAASADNYAAGVQLAISEQRFQKGVARTSPDDYALGVSEKGSVRFGPGVATGAPKWARNFAPFDSALRSANLSPRRPRRDPGNLKRSAEVVALMIQVAKTRT